MKEGLIVSIQRYRKEVTQYLIEQIEDLNIAAIRTDIQVKSKLPIIALKKDIKHKYYITPTKSAIDECLYCDYVAIDSRAGNKTIPELYNHALKLNMGIVADIQGIRDVTNILKLSDNGLIKLPDYFATTFSFFSCGGRQPDLELIRHIASISEVPIIAEGKFKVPVQVATAYEFGASNVCIGSEISDIIYLTKKFTEINK